MQEKMKKIIYIEDNVDTAEAVRIILTHEGYETKVAYTGSEGLKLIEKESFDLILLDIMLPDMSGWNIFSKLKVKETKRKVIFLSAIPISSERMNALKNSGIAGYISKPFTKEDLIEKIKNTFA